MRPLIDNSSMTRYSGAISSGIRTGDVEIYSDHVYFLHLIIVTYSNVQFQYVLRT